MLRCSAGVMRSPTKPAPIRPESPTPRMVSASPVATWLTASPSAISAKTSDINVPATMPNSAPIKIEPVNHAPAKPHAAPTIIMPSTPRLSTPERSVTSSPVAAIRSGVEAASTARMMASMSSTSHLSVRENQLEAVEDEGIAGEHVEQQDALKNLCHVQRDLHRDLRLLAADKGQREKKACN
ncbi:hypothetical protein ACVWXL_004937 [Bradyrhizobium sp. GM22.5]